MHGATTKTDSRILRLLSYWCVEEISRMLPHYLTLH